MKFRHWETYKQLFNERLGLAQKGICPNCRKHMYIVEEPPGIFIQFGTKEITLDLKKEVEEILWASAEYLTLIKTSLKKRDIYLARKYLLWLKQDMEELTTKLF